MLATISQLLIILGLNAYLPWRIGRLLSLNSSLWLYILFAAGLVSGFVSISLVTRFGNIFVNMYYNVAWTWLGTIMYLACFMIIFEIINLIYKLPPVKSAWALIVLASATSIFSMYNATSFRVTDIAIPIKGLIDSVKIVQISDVHLGASRSANYMAKIVEQTNGLKPDFVVITGDIIDSKAALTKNMLAPLKNMQQPAYFVYGNHDVYAGLNELLTRMKENGVTVLQNEVVTLSGIKLVGLNYMRGDDSVYDPHQVTDETIKDILPTLDLRGDIPKVVLHHGPWGIEYMNQHGIDLALAGHTHAGQVFPATILAKLFFPYNKGLSEYKGTYMYVSQGAATFMPRMRLGTKNEITFITLEAQT